MRILNTLADLRSQLRSWRDSALMVGFAPTMGNLHAGHFSLIRQARRPGARVLASIFVNPTQFGPGEDFASYPRTPEEDAAGLEAAGCDALFLPAAADIYPFGLDRAVRIAVPGLDDLLCGASRPGHFSGVATVVTRLLCLTQPDYAVFGQKDYQQLRLIEHLVADLALPVRIEPGATVRDPDGLAMSSRNRYLSPEQRSRAPALYRALTEMVAAVQAGRRDFAAIEAEALLFLRNEGLQPDYATLRRRSDLLPPANLGDSLVALVAARLGPARLIDNIEV